MSHTAKPSTMVLLLLLGAMAAADLHVLTDAAQGASRLPAAVAEDGREQPGRFLLGAGARASATGSAERAEVAEAWARFSDDDCVKQTRADQAQCIPCKKNLSDGTQVDRFAGNCKRDATVLASQIFTPWHFCHADGGCPQGRLAKFRGRICWAFNRGEFTRFYGPAGVCVKESWRTRQIPTVEYARANMAHGWKNTADFVAAYQWSMEEREKWGDRPETVMTCRLFCGGRRACGEVGDCSCGEECGANSTTAPTTAPPAPSTTTSPAGAGEPQFAAADGGADRVCRGANSSDNSGSYYALFAGTPSLKACKALCVDEPACKGIEYKGGRCEVWSRAEGIGATRPASGYTCLRYEARVTQVTFSFVPVEGGIDRACRGSDSSDNSPSYYVLVPGVSSLDACKALCTDEPMCKGIEYKEGRCEVWTREAGIEATRQVPGYTCLSYVRAIGFVSATRAVGRHGFLANSLIQSGVATVKAEMTRDLLDEL